MTKSRLDLSHMTNNLAVTHSLTPAVRIAIVIRILFATLLTERRYVPSRVAKIFVPGTTNALLTQTSKMPGPSWSLPAGESCPRRCGTICEHCYAEKGCYVWQVVQDAQWARFNWTRACMKTAEGRALWVSTMVNAIRAVGCDYFRVHDSGDMFSPAYADCWLAVCSAMPEVKFWIPTRSWQQPSGILPVFDPIMNTLRRMAKLPNVTVRPSALNFGDYAPKVAGLHAGSTAAMPDMFRARQCPAYLQDGHCLDCRTCWDDKTAPVSYNAH